VSEPTLADTGFAARRDGVISGEHLALLAATLDTSLDAAVVPLPWHWACFLPDASTASLGPDGHPRRRAEMADFPNRMWVGGQVEGIAPLQVDRAATRESALGAVDRKDGSTGSFWLLQVEHTISQDGEVCIRERQDIILRGASATPVPSDDGEAPSATWVEERTADPPLLFRYSSLTFNSHRIHYDFPYATTVEGYPDLVVHGPLTATLLCDLAARQAGHPVVSFEFRARAPLFANRRFWLAGDPVDGGTEAGAAVRAVRSDGTIAMTCTVQH
jgi:3-methylfumaryl-CoA hydratase